jgi:SAM-dependent methyltransferase
MYRNFRRINYYLNILSEDVYPQPPDDGHTNWALDVFGKWIVPYRFGNTVLDVGCGDTAFMKPHFEGAGYTYTGVALNTKNPDVVNMDFSFLEFPDSTFDLIFSRHSLEHSPMPILTLMEWYRVANGFLCLILPNPETYGWAGLNHYSVLHKDQVRFLLNRSGWRPLWEDTTEPTEIRLMCEKMKDQIYE